MDRAPPSAAAPSTSTQTLDVFVSYAREDREFVVQLTDALRARGRTAWVDLEGIPPSADYMLEIEDAIVRAQAYVFVASPDSARSAACADEAATADRHNKKIVPIVAQEVDAETLPAAVASRQWINAQAAQDFERAVDALVSAVDTDLAWIRTHTRLLHEAMRWHADHDGTSLLEGRELEDAQAWLRAAELHDAQPTLEQTAFIAASRWAASLARAQRHYEVAFELSSAGRRQAAAAHLLRAVELSPPEEIPAGYPVSPERPGWVADAWSAFRYLDAERGHLVGRLRVPAAVSCLAVDPSGTVVAVGCMSGAVTLWDLERCSMITELEGIGDTVTAVAVSPAREIVAAGADGSLLAWAAHADTPRSLLRSSGNPVTAIALAPDGRRAFGLRDGHVLVRDPAGNDLHDVRLHTGSITSLAFDAEGRLLTGSGRPPSGNWLGDGTAIAWEPQRDKRRPLLYGTLEGAPVAAAPSPDAGAALRSLAGGTVELWSVSPGERRLLGHPETVRAVAFSAAGDVAITGGDDGTVRTWDVDTGVRQASLDAHLGPVTCVAQTADGRLLLSGSLDASVAVWVVDREDARAALTDDGGAIAVSPNDDIAVGASGGAVQLLDAGGVPVATLGRSGPVMSVAVSPDGDTVLAGHEDGAVAVWDARSRARRAVVTGHDGIIWELAFSPDGMLAGSACDDGTVRLWDTAEWTPRATLAGHDGAVHGVAFTADGGQVVTCGRDGTARLWTTDGAMVRILGHARHPLTSVAVTPDAGSVVASAEDGVVHVWDAEATPGLRRRRRGQRTIKAHGRPIRRIALSADGRVLLTASFDATINCWELANGRKLQAFTGHKDSVYGVAIVDGRVYSAGADGTVWVWDVGADQPVGSYNLSSRRASAVAVSADGTTMAASTLEGDVYAWETARFQEPATLAVGHTAQVDGLAFNADGSLLASVARDRTARLWRVESADQVIAEGLGASATSVAWHPSGRRLVCGTGDKQELVESSDAFGAVGGRIARAGPASGGAIVWDFHAGPPRFLERHAGPVQGIAITPDGRIVTGGDDASVRVWDADSGRQLRLLEGHRDRVWAVAVSPDGALAATGSLDNDVRLWHLESGACTRVIEHHSAGVGSVAFTREGALLVTASADGSVRLIDVATGEEVRALRGHDGGVVAVAVDAAGRRALSGTLEGELLLWDMSGADTPRALPPHADSIWGIAITRDGRTGVTTSEDGTARVWDLDAEEVRHRLNAHDVPLRHAAISPDGLEVAIGAADYAVRRWDLRSGEPRGILTGHWSEAISVAYAPDGATIASGGEDGTVRRWAGGDEDALDWVAGQWGDALVAVYDATAARIVVGGADGSVRLWDADRGELLAVLGGHTAAVTDVRMHPDGRRAVSCSMDGSVRLWDLTTGRAERTFTDNEGPVSAVLFTDDGDVIVSASVDETVRVRSTRTGRPLRVVAAPRRPRVDMAFEGTEGSTMQLAVGAGVASPALARGPDGRSVLVGSGHGTSRVTLLRPDTPSRPPRAGDPETGFESLYRSVGLRIAAGGALGEELTLA